MGLTRIGLIAGLILARAYGQSTCINFPAGLIPFSSISYVTAADSASDHLVVGVPAPGALSLINSSIPLPAFTNQTFCDAQVQLAPQQFYPNVYIPTAAELTGNFSAFAGLFVNAANGQPYPNGTIPSGQLANVFAWRIGPVHVTSANQGWSLTGSLTQPRSFDTAALLPSGKVLVVGQTSAEVYDPSTGAFASAGKTLSAHGGGPTATLLNNGQVLILGGNGSPSAAELYDPVSGKFAATGSPTQTHGYWHTTTLLNDGRVLVVGGLAGVAGAGGAAPGAANAGAEIYAPETGAFGQAGPMAFNRNYHTATLMTDGRVLIAGGYTQGINDSPLNVPLSSTEIYDPSTGAFSSTNPMIVARSQHVAALLSNG
jgi:hypothetical protein